MAIIEEIEDFGIPSGAGSKIETCYIADSWDDMVSKNRKRRGRRKNLF